MITTILTADKLTAVHDWLKFGIALLTFAGLTITPVLRLVKKYKKALEETEKAITKQAELNTLQEECLQANHAQNEEIKESLERLSRASLTMIKVELEKRCQEAINKGSISLTERRTIEELFGDYAALNGNHGMISTVKSTRQLPLEPERKST